MASSDKRTDQPGNGTKVVLCPYCGHTQRSTDRCEVCRGLFEPLSRRATQIAMGPWFIRDKNNPFRPGCSYEVLKRQIEAGRVKPHTVLRGPTTRQFWSVARNVPGVAHLLGYCHACGAHVQSEDRACPQCKAAFHPVKERNALGLLFESSAEAAAAQKALEAEQRQQHATVATDSAREQRQADSASSPDQPATGAAASTAAAGGDLLDEVLGKAGAGPSVADAGSASTVATSAAPNAVPETLDFSPTSDTPAAGEPTVDLPAAGRSSMMTWLLVTLNVLVLVLIVLLIWSKARPSSAVATPMTGLPSTLFTDADAPPGDVPDSIAADVNGVTADAGRTGASHDDHDVTPGDAATTRRNADSAITNLHDIAEQMEQARRLETQGKLPEALALLESLSQSLAADERPIGLDSYIHRLEQRMERREAASFFGIPTQ